ncbi:MAG TPA: hypothetical protein VHY08_25005 [Bacillota bacterium]|nr:hypothetical protein [Bacillota bacterium]
MIRKKSFLYSFITLLILIILSNSLVFSSSGSGPTSFIPLSGFIPCNQTYEAEALTFEKKVHTNFIYHITVAEETGNVEITATSADFQFSGHYDSSLWLIDTVTTYSNPQAVQLQGYDKRTAVYYPKAKQVTLRYFVGAKEISAKTLGYNERTVDSEVFFIYLQGMLLKGVQEFNGAILLKLKGMKLDASFKLLENVSLSQLAPQTKYPDFFRDLIASPELFDVYEMRLTGLAGLFYPHKFYFAYRKSLKGCFLAAYWCGAGSEEEYYRFK